MKIKIGNLEFETQKDAISYYREILNNSPLDEKLSEQDFENTFSVIVAH